MTAACALGTPEARPAGGPGTHTCRVAHPTPVAKRASSGLPPLSHLLTEQRSSKVTSNAPPWAGELRLPFRIPQPHRDPHLGAGPQAASVFTCLLPDLSGAPRTLP